MYGVRRTLVIVALVICAMGAFVRLAVAAGGDVRRLPTLLPALSPVTHAVPTAPPLPFGASIPATQRTARDGMRSLGPIGMHPDPTARRPRTITVSEALRTLKGRRSIRSASGATIVLVGTQNVPVINFNFTYTWDGTLQYGAQEQLQCWGMKPTQAYNYVVFAPKVTATAFTGSAGTTDANGNCSTLQAITFATPFGSGTDPAYPGVWTIAMKNNTTGAYDAITYVVVLSSQSLILSTDAAGNFPSNDYQSGAIVYVNASGLSTTDRYTLGFQYTGGAATCEYTLPPSGAARPGPCFNAGTAVTGITATGGNLTAGWNTATSGGTLAGAYSIVLFDTTTSTIVATQQVSIQPASYLWTLTPYNAATAGTNLNDTFAFDGFTDASDTGVDFKLAGIPAGVVGHTLKLTVSDPNGVTLNSIAAANGATKVATAATDFGTVSFPLKQPNFSGPFGPFYSSNDVYGPTATTFAASVLTAQVYDVTAAAPIASKSFHVLAYSSNFAWTNPTTLTLQATVAGTNETVTVTNNAATRYGPQNADAVDKIKLISDGNETLAMPGGVTSETAIDSNGKSWTLTLTAGLITGIPVNAGDSLPPNGTLQIPVVIKVPAGNCSSAICTIHTQIHPLHGINYSGNDLASNKLRVSSTTPTNVTSGTFSWKVTGGPAPIGAPRFNRAMYVANTGGTASGSNYTLALTLNNTSTSGCEGISEAEIYLPPTFTSSNVSLTNVAIGGNACTGTCNWIIASASLTDSSAGPNVIYIWNTSETNPCAGAAGNYIPAGQAATFTFTFPMWTTTSVFADTTITADPNGGCPVTGAQAGCTGGNATTSFAMKADGTTSSPIVPNTTVLDSTELGIFSLNPTFMKTQFSPSTIGAVAGANTQWQFTNASTAQDANPDYIDKFTLNMQAGMSPTSITGLPAGWTATLTAPNVWVLDVCGAAPCVPTAAQYQNSIAPGAMLNATFTYTTAPPTGNYTMTWTVEGANGGATSSNGTTALSVNSTSATIAFTRAGGYSAAPPAGVTAVGGGTEPTIGSDSDATFGNTFAYVITNNGTVPITSAAVTIPYQDRYFVTAPASSGANVFAITNAPTVALSGGATGTAGTCSGSLNAANYSSSTTGATGLINLTGCTIPPGGVATIYVNMKAPYSIGSEYVFPTSINGGTQATAVYAAANYLKIILDARLTILVPTITGGNVASPAGGTPTTTCAGCTYVTSPATVNFGTLSPSTTFTTTNVVNASVTSDASGSSGWSLSVNADVDPPAAGQTLYTMTSNSSTAAANFTLANNSSYQLIPTASTLPLGNFSGAASSRRAPIDVLMDYQLILGAGVLSGTQTVNLTYTLAAF